MKSQFFAVALLLAAPAWAQDKTVPPVPPPGNVTLSLEEYNRLVELASRTPRHVESAPLPYTIKRADLNFKVANQTVLGTVQLQGETFNKGETKVALTSGMTIFDARQEGKGLPFEQSGGVQTAILNGPADFTVSLDAGLPLNIETGRAWIQVPVPAAGSARLVLEVPGDHTNVQISPGLITNRDSANGATIIEAALVPGQAANISWTTREVVTPAVPREVRFLSNIKSLVSVGEAELRLAVLADVTLLQGEAPEFHMQIPEGYEITGATGPTLDSIKIQDGVLTLNSNAPAQKVQQFLISMERPISATKADVPFVSLDGSQRETGEVLVEGVGTMELAATEGGTVRRMDFKETDPYLRSLARAAVQSAFRYHQQAAEKPSLALAWTRFPDSSVLAAVAERAVATTLVTVEGRSLTEVRLTMKNQAQPFLKVSLPPGASIVSAEVAGEKVAPVEGPDGNRVPLLRRGFRPVGDYEVSFVFINSGTPFAKKGGSDVTLPKMDVPISILQWEVFLPEQYKVKDFSGDAIAADLLPESMPSGALLGYAYTGSFQAGIGVGGSANGRIAPITLMNGQIGGYVVDANGAVVPNAQVTVTELDTGAVRNAVTDYSGRWVVSNLPSGRVKIATNANGFRRETSNLNYDSNNPYTYSSALTVGAVAESVEVSSDKEGIEQSRRIERDLKKNEAAAANQASANVVNLQQRVSGVLPVRVDVPRAGTSYHFARPLVLDEETKVSFTYKTK